ncbi:MAG: lipid asymmetry maintenance ABC transporter permease subunit MlaE [Pseudomonadota bacterium]
MNAVANFLHGLGSNTLAALRTSGHAALFVLDMLRALPAALLRPGLILAQLYSLGNRSLMIIIASGLAVGLVLALQMYYALAPFGATGSLGLVVNLALVRELAPVMAALLFAGRAGTSLTAEIGLMKAAEQLLAMEVMAIDPMARLLAPRFIAGVLSLPILASLFSAVGIGGAYVVAVELIGVDAGTFWSTMQSGVDLARDVGSGLFKAAVFGVICMAVALYQGFECEATPEGVAYATTRAVVNASLWVLGTDFVLTALLFSTP